MNKLKYIVYGLIDPRTDHLFYIGKSCSGTKQMQRHTQPWSLKASNDSKNQQILDIMSDEYDGPIYIILDTAKSRRELEMKERVYIARYRNEITNRRVG